jgi:hypothetical protein
MMWSDETYLFLNLFNKNILKLRLISTSPSPFKKKNGQDTSMSLSAPNDKCPSAAAAVNPLGFVQKKE